MVRRPGALLSMVLGPFLIMGLFGLGYDSSISSFQAELIVPASSGLSTNPADYQAFVPPGAHLQSVGTDAAAAEAALRNQTVDVVVFVPAGIASTFAHGQQSTIRVEYNLINPAKADYATVLAQQLAYGLNQQLVQRTAAAGASALPSGVGFAIPPEVIAAPTKAVPRNLAPTQPDLTSFFGPAVLALILQHLAVTLTALSLIRERRTGVLDVLRVSPVSAFEIVLGKVVAFAILGGDPGRRSSGHPGERAPRAVHRRPSPGRGLDQPLTGRVSRHWNPHLRGVGLRSPSCPARATDAAGLGIFQRSPPRSAAIRARGTSNGRPPAGDPWDSAVAGPDAARFDDGTLALLGARDDRVGLTRRHVAAAPPGNVGPNLIAGDSTWRPWLTMKARLDGWRVIVWARPTLPRP